MNEKFPFNPKRDVVGGNDIEKCREEGRKYLDNMTPAHLMNFAGMVACEVIWPHLEARLDPETLKILRLYDALNTAGFDGGATINRLMELHEIQEQILKALELPHE